MDIHCRFCGEPWDHEELHDQISPIKEEPISYATMVSILRNTDVELG